MSTLTYKTTWIAPGYRSLTLVLVDPATSKQYELHLPPADVQKLIFECADAAQQIGDQPPIDWDTYPSQIVWPTIKPWKHGPVMSNTRAGAEPATRQADHGRAAVGRTGDSISPTGATLTVGCPNADGSPIEKTEGGA